MQVRRRAGELSVVQMQWKRCRNEEQQEERSSKEETVHDQAANTIAAVRIFKRDEEGFEKPKNMEFRSERTMYAYARVTREIYAVQNGLCACLLRPRGRQRRTTPLVMSQKRPCRSLTGTHALYAG